MVPAFSTAVTRAAVSIPLILLVHLLVSASPANAANGSSGASVAAFFMIAKLLVCAGLFAEAWGLWVESRHSDHIRLKRFACIAFLSGAMLTITGIGIEATIA